VLNELEIQLPAIRTQAARLHRLYDSSRDKVLPAHSTSLFMRPLKR
jgi:hypothetical protein